MEAQERKKSMKRCKITAVRKTEYKDLMEKCENPIQHADVYKRQADQPSVMKCMF